MGDAPRHREREGAELRGRRALDRSCRAPAGGHRGAPAPRNGCGPALATGSAVNHPPATEADIPVNRDLSGEPLKFRLGDQAKYVDADALERTGRSARTLLKEGVLRVTLIRLAPGGGIPTHSAEGPVTIHVLDGSAVVSGGGEHALAAGELLSLPPGLEHDVASDEGATLLLTVAHPGD